MSLGNHSKPSHAPLDIHRHRRYVDITRNSIVSQRLKGSFM